MIVDCPTSLLKNASLKTAATRAFYRQWQPDIIVLDVMLPVMTGYFVLKEIRNTLKDKDTTIIMSTSLSKKDDVTTMMKLGIQGYIIKPFGVWEIGGRILKYYEKAHSQEASGIFSAYEKALENTMKSLLKVNSDKKEEKGEGDEQPMKIDADISTSELSAMIPEAGKVKE